MLVDHHSEADTETELMRCIEAEQAGHTEQVEEIKYAVSSLSMGNYSDQMLGLFCNASKKWQIKCQVIPTGVQLNYKESLAQFYPSHLEAGLFQEKQTEQSKVKQPVQNAIDRKQTVIQLGESLAEQILAKLNTFSISSSLLSTSNTLPAEALDQLRHVLCNHNAYWSSDSQQFGVLGALDGTSDVLVISATGSGKTMIAIIAALLNPAEITVMVIPLRQLQNDY
ncbi:hypothetical protein D9757_015207 [Collybiopsis confluens]|uniref:DEAD/DEAH-box helicase domain-containing protein n=1 Tax=Collybiopsis confluens TaxID=2823264 RepID=A0A8H5GJD1_9AGAR|nr:hypothetical protein D9757_015207 [Collybiopsis confluens]